MHELATLNQMFASQIVQQAEQIELLYNQVGLWHHGWALAIFTMLAVHVILV